MSTRTVLDTAIAYQGYVFPPAEQSYEELTTFLHEFVRNASSVLEVGSGSGGLLAYFTLMVGVTGLVRTISMPRDVEEANALHNTILKLRDFGYDVDWYDGNSHSREAVEWAVTNGPYDVIFIDAQHAYRSVRSDWLSYGPLGQIVAFHDVHEDPGVQKFWAELKDGEARTEETVQAPGFCGIGVVLNPQELLR